MKIDHTLLDPSTLDNILAEYILREGTDYGLHEITLTNKIAALHSALTAQELFLVYDQTSQSCNLVNLDDYHD